MTETKRFTLFNDFSAALYDRRFYNKPLNKKKFRDIYRAGFIIDSFYTASLDGNETAKEILISLSKTVVNKSDEFHTHYKPINELIKKHKDKLRSSSLSPNYIPYQWSNKMYLSLVDLLVLLDKAYINLDKLMAADLIDTKYFWKIRKDLTNPLRSILEKIYLSNK